MKTILNKKPGERKEKQAERRKTLDKLCSKSTLLLYAFCNELHSTDSRWTQNTGTSPSDITLNYNLWSDRDKNATKITAAELCTQERQQGKKGKHFRRSLAGVTRSDLNGVSSYPCLSFWVILQGKNRFSSEIGFPKHEIRPAFLFKATFGHYRT